MKRTIQVILCASVVFVGLVACEAVPPPLPRHSHLERVNLPNGVSIRVPDTLEIKRMENEVQFVANDHPFVTVYQHAAVEADRQGLWADYEPVERRQFGEVQFDVYDYAHQDVFSTIQTQSYVVPFRGIYLAIAFRGVDRQLREAVMNTIEFAAEDSGL